MVQRDMGYRVIGVIENAVRHWLLLDLSAPSAVRKAVRALSWAARVADHYHSASEHGIIGRLINTVVAGRFRRRCAGLAHAEPERSRADPEGRGFRMAAMKPRTGDGPLEVTKEGRGIVMRVPLEGGGRLVVELTPDEAKALSNALESAVG